MDGADILGIVALAIGGGAGSYVAWYVSRFGGGALSDGSGRRSRSEAGMAYSSRGPGEPGALPATHDPLLAAEVAALREEIAAIAATQARMLQEQSEREGMLLAEMRAVSSVMDPKIVESLARIETTVGSTQAPDPDPDVHTSPAPPEDADRLSVVPDEREDISGGDADSGRTIRRG